MATILADVFLQPARSIIVHTTPGREVKFFGGNAKITDHRDMPFMLARPDVKVIPTEAACSWAEDWLRQTRELKATVEWPEGWQVEFVNQDEWLIERPDNTVLESAPAPVDPPVDPPVAPPFGSPNLISQLLAPEPPVKTPRKRGRR